MLKTIINITVREPSFYFDRNINKQIMLEYIAALELFVYGIYYWLSKDHDYWKKRNVPFVQPSLLVGNMGEALVLKKSFGEITTDLYRDYKKQPYIGIFNIMQPALLINDLDIVKNILVKDFNKFHDNTIDLDEEVDPILAKNPFFLKGDRWKITRSQLTPLLTIAKTKAMLPLVQQVCKNMVKYLDKAPGATGKDGLDTKELALKFTTDTVASCAFGLEGHSFEDPNAQFRKMADDFLKPTTFATIKFMLFLIFPSLIKALKIPAGQKEISDKFKKILRETVKYRKDNKVVRNDFLDSLIELKSKPMPYVYTDDYMVAHALTFFLDGSETSAIVFSFAMFELAANPGIQNKFKKEIDSVLSKHGGSITFDAIQEMTYLDAIFLETLRKYPPLMAMSRECTQEAEFSSSNNPGQTIKVEKGMHVIIPISALHRDPQYYPDPDCFDPDRFTDEAKHPLPKNCFFGFGDGPRICLGQRFGNMQVKAGLIAVVSNFEIRLNNKTKFPFEMEPRGFHTAVLGGIWLNFSKRKKHE